MRTICCLLLGLLVTGASKAEAKEANANSVELATLLDEVWQSTMREAPLFATRTGDHRYNALLGEVSLAAAERRNTLNREYLERLEAIADKTLTTNEQLERKLLIRQLHEAIEEYQFGAHLMPITGRNGFHVSFPELGDRVPLQSVTDYENYIARLRAFGEYTEGHIALMQEGVRRGLTLPAVILEGYEETISAHIVADPEESMLYKPLKKLPKLLSAEERQRLEQEARLAISEVVVPAFKRFLQFMKVDYVPHCRATVGISALPGGRDYYRYRVRKYTTLDLTPEEVHQRGLNEVKRIRSEMLSIIEQVGFEGDFAAFVEHLRTEPRFYADTEEELLAATSRILKRADARMPKLFRRLPRMPYGVEPVPAFIAPKTTAAYYSQPAGDGSRAGTFYINTYDLKSRPLYMLEALSLHEAVPGHHHQIALQQELGGLSLHRRFGGFTAFTEGWGLYAERLGLEAGFYTDPYSDFGRLSMEIWRACRLVVDTGIHYMGWSRSDAIDFMTENSAMSAHNIRAEVDRYIGWPGQALAYKTGELKIRELRAHAEASLGDRFDLRDFHDELLHHGAVPLDVLEELVEAWIAKVQAGE